MLLLDDILVINSYTFRYFNYTTSRGEAIFSYQHPVRGPTRLKGVVGRRPFFEGRLTSNGTTVRFLATLRFFFCYRPKIDKYRLKAEASDSQSDYNQGLTPYRRIT